MLITEIKPGKRNTYYIFVENEFLFSAYEDILYKYSLKENKEVDKDTLIAAQKEQNIMYAKNKALDILSRAAVSEKALFNKLVTKGIDKDAAAVAVAYAKDYGYINDEALLPDIIKHLINDKKYGKQRIFSYLYSKGFDKELISTALEDTEDDPTERIITLIEKEKADMDDRKAVSKLYAKLQRKGYSFSQIKAAMREFTDMEFEE